MRKNFGSKSWLYPMPVLIIATYDKDGTPDAMNAAWGGICGEGKIGICLAKGHKTTENILANKAFTVSMGTEEEMKACDYVGLVSGNTDKEKFNKSGFHATKSEFVNAPVITELPMTLECELVSYDENTNFMTGKIINVSADEKILDEKGTIQPALLKPILFDSCNMAYLAVGDEVGKAFNIGKELV